MNLPFLASLAGVATILAACSTTPETPAAPTKPLTAAQQKAQIAQLKLAYGAPEQIDSSAYVLYPLVLGKDVVEEESEYSSSSRYEVDKYWNLAFYNPTNGTSHLLDSTRRMVIYSYEPKSSDDKVTSMSAAAFAEYVRGSFTQVDKLLYYSVRTLDFNHDGELTRDDPNYLFISDKAGNGFRQVSPDTYNVHSWQLLLATNKILLQATADTNHNQKFDENDTDVLLVYDLATGGPAKEVFNEAFKTKVKNIYHAQWAKKPVQ
ncbi:hypothetical protein [Hymenobacter negativus]|uniref:Lipoprotein n=1 Tax=Hymenobacter negativus TaxID=2795026 RepID=A0ABS3QCM0_9BACT|nr:hypothetical protein [Hymenobacter negativus]MBO2008871.1 hypothetical protein [Hymenobacter negativus]